MWYSLSLGFLVSLISGQGCVTRDLFMGWWAK
jgi:hypothetical protein